MQRPYAPRFASRRRDLSSTLWAFATARLHAAAAFSTSGRPSSRAAAAAALSADISAALAVSFRIRAVACTASSILPSAATAPSRSSFAFSHMSACIDDSSARADRPAGTGRGRPAAAAVILAASRESDLALSSEIFAALAEDSACARERAARSATVAAYSGSPARPYALDARRRSAAAASSSLDDRANALDARASGSAARIIASPARPIVEVFIAPFPSTTRAHFSAARFIASPNSTLAAHPLRHSVNDA